MRQVTRGEMPAAEDFDDALANPVDEAMGLASTCAEQNFMQVDFPLVGPVREPVPIRNGFQLDQGLFELERPALRRVRILLALPRGDRAPLRFRPTGEDAPKPHLCFW